jgi:protein disulfide-isomerase A6
MDWNAIANFAARKMQSFVSIVSDINYEQFAGRDATTKHKILLFSEKKSTPALFKALSKKFKDKLVFGEVKSSETDLVKAFGVTKFPTLIAVTDFDSHEGVAYDSELKVDQVTKFLSTYAYSKPE